MRRMKRSSKSHPKLYYGWYIVMSLGTVGMISVGMGGINFGLFIPSMSLELGIASTFFGWAYTARLIGFSTSSWFIGTMLDRHGARIPMAVAGVSMGAVMIGLSLVQTSWQLVALYFCLGLIGMEGAGGNLYQAVPLSRWFVAKRGKAMSMIFLGSALGIFIFSPLTELLIATHGWRSAWGLLGGGGSLIVVLMAVLVIRKDPYSMGILPDGELSTDEASTPSMAPKGSRKIEYSWTRSQAVHSHVFWAIVAVIALRSLSVSTIHVFRIPYYIEQGVSPHLVAWAISVEAVIAAAVSLLAGRALERFAPRFVMAAALALFLIVFVVTINIHETWHVYVATALYGASASSFVIAQNTLWPAYFGSLHIGAIRGTALLTTLIFSAVGAPISGAIKDATGSYTPTWIGAAVLLGIATLLMLMTRKPQPPEPTSPEVLGV